MPAIALQVISFVQLALQAAPAAKGLYDEAKKTITSLFEGGLISAAQQNALMSWADAHQVATLAGEVPPEFQVEP